MNLKKKIIFISSLLFFVTLIWPKYDFAAIYGDWEYEILEDDGIEIVEYKGNETTVTIPSEIEGKAVTDIGECAFEDCSDLKSIDIPNSVVSIGEGAFLYCTNLSVINIPNSVEVLVL